MLECRKKSDAATTDSRGECIEGGTGGRGSFVLELSCPFLFRPLFISVAYSLHLPRGRLILLLDKGYPWMREGDLSSTGTY